MTSTRFTFNERVAMLFADVVPISPISVPLLDARGSFVVSDAHAGADAPGKPVIKAGELVTVRSLAALAAAGVATVEISPRPRVVVLCLGDDDLAPSPTSAAQSNALVLAAAAQEAGATVYRSGPGRRRDVSLLTEAIEDQLVRADLIMAVGGRGNGVYDDLLAALEPLGGVVFAEVDMQPAVPHGFTRIGESQTPMFVLPGDTLAAFTIFEVFVRPMIRVMAADPRPFRAVVQAKATVGWSSAGDVQEFRYGWLETVDGDVRFTPSQHTQHLMILAESNAMASVPVGVHEVADGAAVLVIPLDGAP